MTKTSERISKIEMIVDDLRKELLEIYRVREDAPVDVFSASARLNRASTDLEKAYEELENEE